MKRKLSRRQVLERMALGLIGLTAAGRAGAQARAKLRLVLPTPATTYQLPFLVAKDTGWYADHGLDVEEIFVGGDYSFESSAPEPRGSSPRRSWSRSSAASQPTS
jgi:ABC-type nitrate/sulfonate/bicarbonate transport system substrate-binding protein